MEWLKPALAYMAASAALLAATFFYVWYSFVRKPLAAALVAGLAGGDSPPRALLVAARPSRQRRSTRPGRGVPDPQRSAHGRGCHDFVHRRLPLKALALVALPFLLWTLLAPVLTERFLDIQLPYSLLLGGSYLWTAAAFSQLRRQRRTQGCAPHLDPVRRRRVARVRLSPARQPAVGGDLGFSVAAALAIGISICLLIMILEDARSDAERERARVKVILENLPVVCW